jgi:hypothetical protein
MNHENTKLAFDQEANLENAKRHAAALLDDYFEKMIGKDTLRREMGQIVHVLTDGRTDIGTIA